MAVLTYLRRILESLDHPDMINLILHYLLALPDVVTPNRKPSRSSVSEARKRKSLDLTKMMAERAEEPATPLLFNLVDLILSCLRSRNQQTIHVTLQLVSAILKRHHRYAVFTLLRTNLLPNDAAHRTVGAHEQEVDYLVSLAGAIGGRANFDDVYANTLKDIMARIESHPCSLRLIAPRVSTNNLQLPSLPDNMPGAPRDIREHTLQPDDPLLNAILDLLETFFVNSVETNLSVTETIVDLAICGYMNIEGWLARDPLAYSYVEDEEDLKHDYETSTGSDKAEQPLQYSGDSSLSETLDEARRLKGIQRCRSRPEWTERQLPRILQVLNRLGDQVSSYKQTIPRFEELLEQRRAAFQAAESMLDGPPPPPMRKASPSRPDTPERPIVDEALRAGSPSRPSAFEGFAQRLLSELGTPSRSASPKSRREYNRSSATSTPGSHAGGPEVMTPKAIRVPPKESPLSYKECPTRSGIARSFSAGSARAGYIGPSPEEQDMAADSEASAFAAFDQRTLSKRVRPPNDTLRPIPLDLTRSSQGQDQDHDQEQDEDAQVTREDASSDTSVPSETGEKAHAGTVSVSHILTNIIIFQSFLLEVASLMQVRAGLFDEVRYV